MVFLTFGLLIVQIYHALMGYLAFQCEVSLEFCILSLQKLIKLGWDKVKLRLFLLPPHSLHTIFWASWSCISDYDYCTVLNSLNHGTYDMKNQQVATNTVEGSPGQTIFTEWHWGKSCNELNGHRTALCGPQFRPQGGIYLLGYWPIC